METAMLNSLPTSRVKTKAHIFKQMQKNAQEVSKVILGMREAYFQGMNAMEWGREYFRNSKIIAEGNDLLATLVAYDLQAGSYVSAARSDREKKRRWCSQLADLLAGVLAEGDSILEVGVGEATTLAGVLVETGAKVGVAFGFDVSWSRLDEGRKWLRENGQEASLFAADLLNIPMGDGSVDVVYSSHSLEPNRGREEEAVRECLRVARKAVVLVEPIYELASAEAQARMRHHGYVEGLRATAEQLGAEVLDYRLLDYSPNPLNPSGVLCLKKFGISGSASRANQVVLWRCPITGAELICGDDVFYAAEVGMAYPVLRGIPMLRAEHAIVASKLVLAVPE
jgi:SAM-dependent methyltransferase